jgi:hypothetical protein
VWPAAEGRGGRCAVVGEELFPLAQEVTSFEVDRQPATEPKLCPVAAWCRECEQDMELFVVPRDVPNRPDVREGDKYWFCPNPVERHAAEDPPAAICPRHGVDMVWRVGTKADHQGRRFWWCEVCRTGDASRSYVGSDPLPGPIDPGKLTAYHKW